MMKKIINFILFFLILNTVAGQSVSVDYNFIFTTHSDIFKSNLFIPNDSISVYEIYEKNNENFSEVNNDGCNKKIIIKKPVYLNRKIIKDKNNDSLYYFKTDFFKKKKYIKIKDKLSDIVWELLTETKKILGYNCTKAVAKYKGKDYEAWFTESLPYSDGPWKFSGLPGLILEIKSKDGTLGIEAEKLVLNSMREFKNEKIPYIKEYTWNEYVLEMKRLLKKMKKFAYSSSVNNVEATIEFNEPDYTIKNDNE
ncbi:MAG: GLPGLI family protein [Chlorobi bacterium]|nr:GLPGLI family protein [Chlorobiota bacterium]